MIASGPPRAAPELVLRLLCAITSDVLAETLLQSLDWATDGRQLAPSLARLEEAGLIERTRKSKNKNYWQATDRGREIDRILERIRVDRGGTFQPETQAGITTHESMALRA